MSPMANIPIVHATNPIGSVAVVKQMSVVDFFSRKSNTTVATNETECLPLCYSDICVAQSLLFYSRVCRLLLLWSLDCIFFFLLRHMNTHLVSSTLAHGSHGQQALCIEWSVGWQSFDSCGHNPGKNTTHYTNEAIVIPSVKKNTTKKIIELIPKCIFVNTMYQFLNTFVFSTFS